MTTCHECKKSCEIHNVTYCATCHNHDGECNRGGCYRRARKTLSILHRGVLVEKRPVCNDKRCMRIMRQGAFNDGITFDINPIH